MQFRRFPILIVIVIVTVLLVVAFVNQRGRRVDERTYALAGQVQSITPDRQEAMVKHAEIKGLMPAMTMPYRFKTKSELDALKPGDLIDGTLVIVSNDAYLTDVKKTGEAPIEKPPAEALVTSETLDKAKQLLRPGDTVPDGDFVDQSGRKFTLSALRGSTVVLTFIYTRCPLPNFCPLMSKNFAELEQRLSKEFPNKYQLLSISMDPDFDRPEVLKEYAARYGADPKDWSFAAGDAGSLNFVAGLVGLYFQKENGLISHDLRTALIGPDGRLVQLWKSNVWTPYEVQRSVRETLTGHADVASR